MDAELKKFLEDNFAVAIQQLKEYTDERLAATEQRVKEYTDERTHDMETKLLKAFRNWAVRVEAKMSVQKATTDGMSDRLNVLEQRVDDLEAKN